MIKENLFNQVDNSHYSIDDEIKGLFEEEFLTLLQEYKSKGGNKFLILDRFTKFLNQFEIKNNKLLHIEDKPKTKNFIRLTNNSIAYEDDYIYSNINNNLQFYKVIQIKNRIIKIQEVKKQLHHQDNINFYYIPSNEFIDNPRIFKLKFNSYTFRLWNGVPKIIQKD